MKYPQDFNKQAELNIWLSKIDSFSFDYSDGKEEENYLEECLKKTTNLSFDSPELTKFIHDWSSEYHFSPKRNNLLRCLKLKNTDTVLELGAGCGSITRYLGENTSQVIAIEGSKQRAKIAALRCRDLDNVNIICSPFQDIELTEKFDIVTLIGVLEYSGKYIDAENPYQIALENAKKYLKDNGVLIVAIENKLGMKYFAGCSEDYSGLLFDGIEGYPSKHPVQTFGKKELADLLELSGFNYQKFLYPFPDYKVPNVILNLDEIEKHNYPKPFIYNWIGYHNSRDYGRSKNEYLHEFLLAKQLETNGILSQFSNSFLVICGVNSNYNIQKYIDNQIFAYKFNATRYKEFMTGTYLRQLEFNSLVIEKQLIYPHIAKKYYENQENSALKHEVHETAPFIDGTLLIDLLIKALKNKTKDLEESLLYPLKLWNEFLLKESKSSELGNGYLSGQYVDCVPWNLLINTEGKLIYIDQEWNYLEKIDIKFVLFRGLLYFYQMLNPWLDEAFKNKDIELTFQEFFAFCTGLLNIDISSGEIRTYLKLEFDLQTRVSYLYSNSFSQYSEMLKQKTQFLITDFFVDKDKSQLQETQSQLQETQSQLQETQSQLQETQSQLQETQSQLQETQSQLQETQSQLSIDRATISWMETSKFWKLRKIFLNFKNSFGIKKFFFELLAKLRLIFILIFNHGFTYAINLLKQEDKIPLSDNVSYQKWLDKNYPCKMDLILMTENIKKLKYKPVISIIMPVYNTSNNFSQETINSVLNQVYPYWELCIVDDASTKAYIKEILKEYITKDKRIKVVFSQENAHISQTSNSGIEVATGEYIALLDYDDLLTPHALYEVVKLLNQYPEADMIYSDEDKISEQGKLQDPYFKPDWCPDSFLSRMYTCNLGVYRRELINEIGGFRESYESSQDYDLVLRFTEKTDKIFHIPNILYHWRIHDKSTSQDIFAKNHATIAAQRAIKDAIERRCEPGKVLSIAGGHHLVRYEIKNYDLVSIIIPTKNLGNILNTCLKSIFEKTTYPNYEVLVIDNGSTEQETKEIIELWKIKEPQKFKCEILDIPFNFSKINNYAVKQVQGKYLLFLNNDTEVINNDWLEAMVEQAQRDSIGAVGALLLYPDNTIQHAGVIAGMAGLAGHSHKYYECEAYGYFNQLITNNNCSAVTGACLMCRSEVFEEVGGFEEDLAVAFNDIDLCFKILNKGYRNIYLPHVKLYHYESKSRGYEDTPEKKTRFIKEVKYMQSKWQSLINHDPCYNPNLSKEGQDYVINV